MNAKVHPLVVVLVVFLTLFATGVWVWGSGEAKRIGGPSELKVDPDGHLYIQIQNQLLEHNAGGKFLERHDLAKLGVNTLLGGFAFFSDGEILLRRGPDPRSFLQTIRAYQRRTNDQSLTPTSPDTGLYRCNIDTRQCRKFGTDGIDLKAAYSVFIDWQSDDVYVADTTRHVLRKYSADGESRAAPAGGFRFPNQLIMHEGQLYVADTNLHQVRMVDPRSSSFGEELGALSIKVPVSVAAGQIWPSHIARVGEEWWVNNMRRNMADGGIYVFGNSWTYSRQVALPPGADPISILPFNGEVLVSDWDNDRVHRFSTGGLVLDDFMSPGLDEVLAESRMKRLQFETYGYAGIALFLLVIVGLIVRMIATKEPSPSASMPGAGTTATTKNPDDAIRFEPDQKIIRKVTTALRLAILLTIVFAVLVFMLVLLSGNYQVGFTLILPVGGLAAICAIIAWASRANAGTAIDIEGSSITLQDHRGRESTCALRDVVYDHTAIATPETAVFLGQPHMSVYDRTDLDENLFPRLVDAQRVSVWKMQSILFRRRHPQGMSLAVALFGILAGIVGVMIRNSV
jgi:hypothetical protein